MKLTVSSRLGYEPSMEMDVREFLYIHSSVVKDINEENKKNEMEPATRYRP